MNTPQGGRAGREVGVALMRWVPVNLTLFPALQRVWSVVAANLPKEMATHAQAIGRDESSIVEALCTCVLGDRGSSESAAWPPRSVAELCGRSGGTAAKTAPDAGLLEDGLDALDELARRETGWRFARLDHSRQLRSLFQFEAGRGRLSRRHASAFMDTFLTLAAQAYLRDTLQLAPVAGHRRLS